MTTKRSTTAPNPSPLVKAPEFDMLDASQDFKVTGRNGWFHFHRLVTSPAGEQWIDAFDARGIHRSFTLDKLRHEANGNIVTRLHPTP